MTKAYRYSIIYFLAFSLLLLLSSYLLFDTKIGFSYTGVLEYYLGNEEKFILAKTQLGVLKLILPHIFAFGLFMMVMLHFLIFTKYRNTRQVSFIIYASYITAFLELSSPFFILHGFEFFALVKLFSFFGVLLLTLYVSWLLFFSALHSH